MSDDIVSKESTLQIEQHFRYTKNMAYDAQRGKRLVLEELDPARKTCLLLHKGIEAMRRQLYELERENKQLKDRLNEIEVNRP